MEPARRFGENVKRERQRKGFSQEELANAAGVHPTQISHVEGGDRSPRFMTILRLAKALEVEPGRLFDGVALTEPALFTERDPLDDA